MDAEEEAWPIELGTSTATSELLAIATCGDGSDGMGAEGLGAGDFRHDSTGSRCSKPLKVGSPSRRGCGRVERN